MSDTQLMERQDRETVERLEPAPRRRRTIVPIAIVSGVVALFVVIGIWVVSSLQRSGRCSADTG